MHLIGYDIISFQRSLSFMSSFKLYEKPFINLLKHITYDYYYDIIMIVIGETSIFLVGLILGLFCGF